MNYYSWFISDENHRLHLKNIIKRTKPEVDELGEEIRLISVVSSVSDEVKSACWALEPNIKLVTYDAFKQSDEITIIPNIILDTAVGGIREIRPPKTEEDHLRGYDNLRPLYTELKRKILELDSNIRINPTPQNYIAFARRKTFCSIHMKRQWIRLDLNLKTDEINNNPKYTQFGNSDWGYIHVSSIEDINEELMNWLKLAYSKAI